MTRSQSWVSKLSVRYQLQGRLKADITVLRECRQDESTPQCYSFWLSLRSSWIIRSFISRPMALPVVWLIIAAPVHNRRLIQKLLTRRRAIEGRRLAHLADGEIPSIDAGYRCHQLGNSGFHRIKHPRRSNSENSARSKPPLVPSAFTSPPSRYRRAHTQIATTGPSRTANFRHLYTSFGGVRTAAAAAAGEIANVSHTFHPSGRFDASNSL